jgi:hypothetical protein
VCGVLEARQHREDVRAPILWGLVWGGIQAASPLAFWWLDAATVYALGLALIASIYIGFAVADGRWVVIGVESGVALMFVLVAAAAITGSGLAARPRAGGPRAQGPVATPKQFIANTRWWPPFCLVVDWERPRSSPSRSWPVLSSMVDGSRHAQAVACVVYRVASPGNVPDVGAA